MRLPMAILATFLIAALSGCMGGDTTTVTVTVTHTPSGGTTSSPTTSPPTPERIDLFDDYFAPNGTVSLEPGTTVTFTNKGMHNHTVTIHLVPTPTEQTVKDTHLTPGMTTTYNFALPGTYHVWCKLHGTMTAGMAMVVTVG